MLTLLLILVVLVYKPLFLDWLVGKKYPGLLMPPTILWALLQAYGALATFATG